MKTLTPQENKEFDEKFTVGAGYFMDEFNDPDRLRVDQMKEFIATIKHNAVEKCRQQTIEELLLAIYILPKATALEILRGITTAEEKKKYEALNPNQND